MYVQCSVLTYKIKSDSDSQIYYDHKDLKQFNDFVQISLEALK